MTIPNFTGKFELSKISELVSESLADPKRFIDVDMFAYALKNIEEEGKNSKFYTFLNKYNNTSDANLKEYYAAMMLMSPTQAQHYINEWIQKEIHNGVYSSDSFSVSDEGGSTSLDMYSAYIQPEATDKGMFVRQGDLDDRANPETLNSIRDFFTKFINHPKLNAESRIVIIARLMLGEAAGSGSMNSGGGLSLNELVEDLPAQYDVVTNKYKQILDMGIPSDKIRANMIISGWKGTNDEGKEISISGLVTRTKLNRVSSNVSKVIKDLTGVEVEFDEKKGWDLSKIYKYLLGQTANEDLGITEDFWDEIDEAISSENRRMDRLGTVIRLIMGGKGSVKTSDLISALVFAVSENIRLRTKLSRKLGKNVKREAQKYLKLAKSNKDADKREVQLLFFSLAMKTDSYLKRTINKATKQLDKLAKTVK